MAPKDYGPVSDLLRTLRCMRERNRTQDHRYSTEENAAADAAWQALTADAIQFAQSVSDLDNAGLIDLSQEARDDIARMLAAEEAAQ